MKGDSWAAVAVGGQYSVDVTYHADLDGSVGSPPDWVAALGTRGNDTATRA